MTPRVRARVKGDVAVALGHAGLVGGHGYRWRPQHGEAAGGSGGGCAAGVGYGCLDGIVAGGAFSGNVAGPDFGVFVHLAHVAVYAQAVTAGVVLADVGGAAVGVLDVGAENVVDGGGVGVVLQVLECHGDGDGRPRLNRNAGGKADRCGGRRLCVRWVFPIDEETQRADRREQNGHCQARSGYLSTGVARHRADPWWGGFLFYWLMSHGCVNSLGGSLRLNTMAAPPVHVCGLFCCPELPLAAAVKVAAAAPPPTVRVLSSTSATNPKFRLR